MRCMGVGVRSGKCVMRHVYCEMRNAVWAKGYAGDGKRTYRGTEWRVGVQKWGMWQGK